ncbi:hypothetical protein OUZ56_006986 [Daphnia magna]|uniref:Uncharacterized protein n=1 Tax=Daphnia magna TaxID=35525 RepID=A0ABQ9YXA7_9CRUS|nr:hypothetical protein OUZ56_006986 [Daphnia magna]
MRRPADFNEQTKPQHLVRYGRHSNERIQPIMNFRGAVAAAEPNETFEGIPHFQNLMEVKRSEGLNDLFSSRKKRVIRRTSSLMDISE